MVFGTSSNFYFNLGMCPTLSPVISVANFLSNATTNIATPTLQVEVVVVGHNNVTCHWEEYPGKGWIRKHLRVLKTL